MKAVFFYKKIPFDLCLFLLLIGLLLFSTIVLQAQSTTVSGRIMDESGVGIPGVTVLLAGTAQGTVTDIDGRYRLSLNSAEPVLVISSIGFATQEVPVSGRSSIDITLVESTAVLSEVVVTALGIERDRKALGYAVQQVDGAQVSENRNTNLVNSLSGKVAGLQVTGANNGLGASSRMVIRGENSLNINSNSPLIVVDGSPINNDTYGTGGNSTAQADLPTDYGNAAADINPDDIASISILKGAAAAALYGSRAANGVVLITTKSGQAGQGIGVQLSSSLTFSTPLVLPQVQTRYGGGWDNDYASNFGTNFGPSLDENREIVQDGAPGFESGESTPFQHRYRLEDFFETGTSSSNSIAISGGSEKGSFKLAYANSFNTGIVPNTDLDRHSFSINTDYHLSDRWKLQFSATGNSNGSDNLSTSGYGGQGIMYALLWNYTNVDLDWLRDYWLEEDKVQRNIFTWGDNPFLIANEHINAFDKNRLFGRLATTYTITPELSLLLRVGTDRFNDFRTSRRPVGSVYHPNGMYREQRIDFMELNTDFLLTYDRRFGEISTRISMGGNSFRQATKESIVQGNNLTLPGIYTLSNISGTPTLLRTDAEKQINSLYGLASVGYKDFIYLDLTARNDWSSTLPAAENSYFYPSASLSVVPTEITELGASLDYLKLRFNIASVGKDTDPYQLVKTFPFATLPNSVTTPDQLPNATLRPERTNSVEVGLESFLFGSRLSIDLSLYRTISKDQIISFAVSQASGFNSVFANAGKIENKGIELALGGSPVRTENFQWNVSTNFTANRGKVLELFDNLESYVIAEGPDGNTVEARPGGRLGDIYGNTYQRSGDGEIVYGPNGIPLLGPRRNVGNYNPDWMMGISNSLSYKRLRLSALFDIRQGGIIYSYTNVIGTESGILPSTLAGREEGIIGEGVVLNSDGTYSPNTQRVTAEEYYYGIRPRSNAEANSYDASFVKLREVNLSYALPRALVEKIGLNTATVSLMGNNLALWTKVPNIDPEAQALNGGSLVPGFEVTQIPSTRSYGMKLSIKF